ncbi:XRE family transcriptional regulator [Salmonella enterica subsp. enterica serovar Omuna]|nr:XRE family transcriptional regulator [Salmonella enterica subsp. enterica serovar Omuna]
MNRAERLRERRLALKLTMREVSEVIGLTIAGVQNLERVGGIPGLDVGLKLARLYQRPVQWIVDGTGITTSAVPIAGTTDTGPEAGWNTPDYEPERGWVPLRSAAVIMFALKITNSNSSSRYVPGDVLLLNAERSPANGNDVFIATDARFIFGRLVRISDQEVIVDELDSAKRHAIDAAEVSGVWEIIGSVNANFVDDKLSE